VTDRITGAKPRRRRLLIAVAAAALCLAVVGAWVVIATRGDDSREIQSREIRLEVTSEAGQVRFINWYTPADGHAIHSEGSLEGPVKTPWSKTIEVKAKQGVINLIVPAFDGTVTCRILAAGKVVEEQTARSDELAARCMTTPQRVFPAS
jgi:hypothetical protein